MSLSDPGAVPQPLGGGQPLGKHGERHPGDAVRKPRLLVLEDDDALRRMLAWELAELGYEVESAGRCREARAVLAGGGFGVALLDVGLPDGDGILLAGEFAADYPDLHILLCSGRHGAFARRTIPSAVLACLTKPLSVHRLDGLLSVLGAGPD